MVAEVALQRAGDARHGVGRERGPARRIEAIDRLDEREAGNLLEILDGDGAALIAPGQMAREGEVQLD